MQLRTANPVLTIRLPMAGIESFGEEGEGWKGDRLPVCPLLLLSYF